MDVKITMSRTITHKRMIPMAFHMEFPLASAAIPKQMPARMEAMMVKGKEKIRARHVTAMIMAGPKESIVGSYI